MLVERVLFRFDSVRDYSHGLDELFASLRPAYLARRERVLRGRDWVFEEVLAAGARIGEFDVTDPRAAAESLLLATNSLLPYALSARELGRRMVVEARISRVADLLLYGLCRGRKTPIDETRSPSRGDPMRTLLFSVALRCTALDLDPGPRSGPGRLQPSGPSTPPNARR